MPEFAGLSDDEVHYGLVSALHVLWKPCRSGVPPAPADAAEAALLLASIESSDGDIINLEPIDILYLMEFHRLYKPGKPSSAVRLEWPSTYPHPCYAITSLTKTFELVFPLYYPVVRALRYMSESSMAHLAPRPRRRRLHPRGGSGLLSP